MKAAPLDTFRVPFFGSWRKAYLAVVFVFIIEVSFFYLVDRFFS